MKKQSDRSNTVRQEGGNSVLAIVGNLYGWGTVLFGIGFLAPLIAQSLDAASMSAPFGNLPFGLAVGASAGLVAKWRHRWI